MRRLLLVLALLLPLPNLAAGQGAVTTIQLSPASPVAPGTVVTVSVSATTPCGAIGINFGDANDVVFPIFTLPLRQAHTYPNAGTFSIVARGQGNCSGQVSTTLDVRAPRPDLTVTLQQTTASPVVNGSATYSVVVRNIGTAGTDREVAVRVDFSNRWHLPAVGPGTGCSGASGAAISVTCQIGLLAAGASRTFAIRMDAPTQINGPSEVFSVGAAVDIVNLLQESNETNNGTHVDTTVRAQALRPDLRVNLTGSPATATAGQNLIYVANVHNTGNASAVNFVVRASLPRELDFVRVEPNAFSTCQVSGAAGQQRVNCTVPLLNISGTGTLRIVTRPIAGLGPNTQILFSVNVDPTNTVVEGSETNNTAFIISALSSSVDLDVGTITIEKIGLPFGSGPPLGPPPALLCHGDTSNVTIRVRITNHGPGQSAQTEVTMAYVTGVFSAPRPDCPDGTFCNSAGACVFGPAPPLACFDRCSVRGLFPGQTAEVVFKATRNRDVDLLGVVIVTSTGDSNPANNRKAVR